MTLSESEFYSPSKPAEQNSPQWRQEVALRVRAHRARRRRRTSGEGALELQFDPPSSPATETVVETYSTGSRSEAEASAAWGRNVCEESTVGTALAQTATARDSSMQVEAAEEVLHSSGPARQGIDLSDAPIAAQVYEPLPPFPRVKLRSRERKVIEFPRLNESSIASSGELAEPVADQLRIFEAIEELPQLDQCPLAGIRLSSAEPEAVPTESKFDLPLPVASCQQRALALAVDCIIVTLGFAAFSVTTFYLALPVILSKPMVLAGAGLALALLTFYQSIFLFYSAATPGMRAAGLVLTDFSGTAPSRGVRVLRAFALALSFAALCLGLVWILIDEDRLGWHDRITHTYLREK